MNITMQIYMDKRRLSFCVNQTKTMEEKQWYFLPRVSKNKPETGAGTTSCQAPGYSFLGGERTKQLNSGEKQGSSAQEEKD